VTEHLTVLERLVAIDARITAAHADVAAGGNIDISELEGEVEAVCKIILASQPKDSHDDIELAIPKVLADLDALARALSLQYQELTGSLIDTAANDPKLSGNSG